MRRHLERQANRAFALAAVAILAVLLLSEVSLWVILVPVWFVSWLVTQIALQHYATHRKSVAWDRDTFGASYISDLFREGKSEDRVKDNSKNTKLTTKVPGLVE